MFYKSDVCESTIEIMNLLLKGRKLTNDVLKKFWKCYKNSIHYAYNKGREIELNHIKDTLNQYK